MQDALHDLGRFSTSNASGYLQQLCKHFAHKFEVRHDPAAGEIALPPGPVRLRANEIELTIEVAAADEAGLETARRIIESHLARFAFREEFQAMDWSGRAAE